MLAVQPEQPETQVPVLAFPQQVAVLEDRLETQQPLQAEGLGVEALLEQVERGHPAKDLLEVKGTGQPEDRVEVVVLEQLVALDLLLGDLQMHQVELEALVLRHLSLGHL